MAIYHSRNHGDCELTVDAVYRFNETQGIRIEWSCEHIGWGQCDLVFENKEVHMVNLEGEEVEDTTPETEKILAYTESMAINEDKTFIRALFEAMMEKMEIVD